jgi:hypothetical protein
MADVTDTQLALAAYHAGWRGADLRKSVAVAFAETGGKPTTDARGDVLLESAKWGPSIGPWQIRSLNAERGKGTTRDELANLDLNTNARHAFQVYSDAGNRFTPWSTYTSGAWLLYNIRAGKSAGIAERNPDAAGGGGPGVGGGPDVINESNPITDAAGAAKNAVKLMAEAAAWIADPHNWMRIAQVTVGAAVVIAGLAVIAGKPVKELSGVVKP